MEHRLLEISYFELSF